MMSFLEFTFQSFWHFAGVLVLIGLIPCSVGAMIRQVRGNWWDRYISRTMDSLPPVTFGPTGNYQPDKSVRPSAPPPSSDR